MGGEVTNARRIRVIFFNDLVGSTKVKERLGPEKYRELKARHDAFLHESLQRAPSGRVLQDTGDGYFITFDSVKQAVEAALLFQARMAAEPWPVPFSSRVGLHLGEVSENVSPVTGQPQFISSAIDQASRAMSLAVGGQILLTRAVYESALLVLKEHPPVGERRPVLAWREHGAYRFKGVEKAVDIFEVGAEGVAPLAAPPDSEKARRVGGRRPLLLALAGGLPLAGAGAVAAWRVLRSDPVLELKRQQVERQVERFLARPPVSVASPSDVKHVDLIQTSDNPGFDVLADDRVVDMRAWKEVPAEKLGEPNSLIVVERRLRLMKTEPAERFEMQGRTTGLDVVLACRDQLPCAYEAQKTESFVGQERMKVRKVSIDVSSKEVGREFDLCILLAYLNSMQSQSEQWFGLIGYQKSFSASMLLLFPERKPFKSYDLTVSPTDKSTPQAYAGPRVVLESPRRDWLYWEIPKPATRHVYRLHWTW